MIFFLFDGGGGQASKPFFQSYIKGQHINLFKKELLSLIQGKSLETYASASTLSPCWRGSRRDACGLRTLSVFQSQLSEPWNTGMMLPSGSEHFYVSGPSGSQGKCPHTPKWHAMSSVRWERHFTFKLGTSSASFGDPGEEEQAWGGVRVSPQPHTVAVWPQASDYLSWA